ncbi:hypothetical protein SAMN02745121_05269 [Nannocystis exedens]|uniref:Uncharacterized protein n=1 Tax=Nannocystis exedens TaxID=54 RepID=A0A1I2CUQ0_9BACT|nr:hypothetical protein [Nannocystis exedens]PCC68595.1 hypothetical protein NAEX_01611 [Nannocystis exedens]SFE72046.1 hypothetical protein SAMN02745121_05269 [Nannocystis exedens]
MLLLLATLLAPPTPPETSVELRVTSVDDGAAKLLEQALVQRLGARLLEDGYRVVPAGRAAGVRVWVHLEATGATIETRGTTLRIETVPAGDPALVSLEIQQLTTALVDEVEPSPAEAEPAVALEVTGAAADPELRERLQRGLLGRGFALTRRPGADDRRLCVAVADSGEARVHVVGGSSRCAEEAAAVPVPAGETVARGRELLLAGAAAALDAVVPEPAPWQGATATNVAAPPAMASRKESPAGEAVAPAERDAPVFTIAAHGGLLARTGGPVDGLVGFGLRVGRRRGLGGVIDCVVVPSRAEQLRVVEAAPTAALDWRIGAGTRGVVALGLFAGVHLHHYAQTGGARDTRVGASAGATVRVGWLGRRGALLFAGLRAGWSGGRWVHVHDAEVSWRRAGLVLGLELGAGWDIALRRGRRR